MVRGKDDRKNSKIYLERAKKGIIYEAASISWAHGVPWSEALEVATTAIEKAAPKPKALPKGKAAASKAKAKAKPKAKALA